MVYNWELDECKKCKRHISKYSIDRNTNEYGSNIIRTYKITLCWGCGYFSINPNILDEFTKSILENRFLIIDLIQEKKLKPIL